MVKILITVGVLVVLVDVFCDFVNASWDKRDEKDG